MDEFVYTCSVCGLKYFWPSIRRNNERVNIKGMLNFIKRQTGKSFDDLNISEAYLFVCDCTHRSIIAEIPNGSMDQNGISAPAYLSLGLIPKERTLDGKTLFKIEKQTTGEIQLKRHSLRLIK